MQVVVAVKILLGVDTAQCRVDLLMEMVVYAKAFKRALLENALLVPVTGRISAGPRDRH